MPYKSKAQQGYFHAAEERGEISPKTVNEFDKASKGKPLPEHVGPKHDHTPKHSEHADGGDGRDKSPPHHGPAFPTTPKHSDHSG